MWLTRKAGIAENTLIVLKSDNGPCVDERYADRAVELLGDHKPWGPFRGGKYSIFEAGTRIPMIVSWPAQVKPGVSDALVSQVDLYASMASLMGKTLEAGAGPDSQDHLDAFLGKDLKGATYVSKSPFSLCFRWEWSIIARQWRCSKLIISNWHSKETTYNFETGVLAKRKFSCRTS